MRTASGWFLTSFFALCAAAALTASSMVTHFASGGSDFQTFYIEGFSKTLVSTAFFFAACAGASLAYTLSPALAHRAKVLWGTVLNYFEGSVVRFAFLSFGSAAAVLFLLNAPGILTGTFLIDDYEMYAIATQKTVSQLFWTPINDHVIPLFWLELKALFALVGTNAPVFNLPLFGAATVAIGAAGVLLRQLRFEIGAFAAFLAICASTTIVSHQMYGFYAVAPYFQVLALFMLSLVCFTHARQHVRFSKLYLAASIALAVIAVFLESSGIWVPLALSLFAIAYHLAEDNAVSIASVYGAVKKEVLVLGLSVSTIAVYLGYLAAIPYFSDASFYGPDRLPLSLATFYEFYKVITAGVLSSFFAPRMGLILSQPRFEHIEILWHASMFVLFAAAACVAWWALVQGSMRARIWGIYFMLLFLGTALLVAIARPSSHAVSFYRDQNLLFPLFFISLALVIVAHEWIRASRNERAKAFRSTVAIAVCVLVFASQLVFSFYKEQYLGDIAFNRGLIAQLRETVVPALNELSANGPVTVPALGGTYLGSSIYQLPDLSEFSYFLGIRDITWVLPGKNAAASSSVFASALRHDERLRAWYLVEGEIGETCSAEPLTDYVGTARAAVIAKPVVIAGTVDTTKTNRLAFDIVAQDAPEKIFIAITFGNAVGATGTLGIIRLDQYTKPVDGSERRYVCTVNLNEIPAYSVSPTVKNISLTIQTPGVYRINALRLVQNGETLFRGTK